MLMELTKENLIWKEGEKDWMPVGEWSEFISLFPAASDIPHEFKVGLDFTAPEDLNPLERDETGEAGLIFEADDEFIPPKEPPVELTETKEFKEFEEGPPSLPPLPVEEVEVEEVEFTESFNSPPDLPPDLPPIPVESNDDDATEEVVEEGMEAQREVEAQKDEAFDIQSEVHDEIKEEDEFDESENNHDSHFELSHVKFYVSSAVGLVAFLVFAGYLWNIFNADPVAYGLAKSDRETIIHVTQQKYQNKIIHKIRPTRDLSSLWLGANYPGEGWSILRLKTIEGRYLGESPVELLSQGSYENGLSYFNEIEILDGEGIVAGEYKYTLEFIPGGLLLRWNMLLRKIPLIGSLISSPADPRKQILEGKILLSPLSKKEFEKKLKSYLQTLDKTLIQPLKERKQRFETFLGLLDQMGELYTNTLNRISKGNTIYLFENEYNKQIGPMLRDLIIDSHNRHLSYLNLDPKLSQAYQELSEFGKEIGELASYMVTKTKKYNRLDRKSSQKLSKIMDAKVKVIFDKGMIHVKDLSQSLEKYK